MDVPFSNDSSAARQGQDSTALTAENILLEEFRHSNVLMYQHRESINSLFSLYLTLVSIVISGVGAATYAYIQSQNPQNTHKSDFYGLLLIISVVLILLTVLSFSFYTVFRNLRQAYQDSLAAMSQIADFYIAEFKQRMPRLEGAFYWRSSPRRHALGGDSRVMNWASQLIGSISFGQTLWVLLIYTIDDKNIVPFLQPNTFAEGLAKPIAWAFGFFLAFTLYPVLYHSFARPPRIQENLDL